jgi:hypothetical protein
MSLRFLLASFLTVAACNAHAAKILPWKLPTGSNVAQPNLSQTPGGDVVLSWIQRLPEGEHRLQMSTYSPQGKWSPIQTIASGKNFFVNWADFPSTQALPDGSIWAHNLEKSGKGTYSYDVVVRRSQDRGKTWTPGFRVNAPVQAEHGFASLWPWSKHQLGLVWLDGAAAATGKEEHAEHGHGGSMMSMRAAVIDSDMQKNLEWPIDLSTCDCCQTDVALTNSGPVVVYRDRSKDEIRDVYTTRYDGKKWTIPTRVYADQWLMPACPVNGPAISAYQNKVWVAWFTSAQQPSVRIAYSHDAGNHFGPMREVAIKNVQGRVDVLSDKNSVWLSWLVEENKLQTVWLAQYSHDLKTERQRFALPAVVGGGRATGFPRMQLLNNNIYMVWTDINKGKPQLRGYVVKQ